MKLSIALVAPLFAVAAAFAPSSKTSTSTITRTTVLNAVMNGFVPDDSKFCYGLPGAIAPFKEGFDPMGISEREDYQTIKTFRESEVTHGRVAMLAGKCMWNESMCVRAILYFLFSHGLLILTCLVVAQCWDSS